MPNARQSFSIALAATRIFEGTRTSYILNPAGPATRVALIGPGRLDGTTYVAPKRVSSIQTAAIVAARPRSTAAITITIAPYPAHDQRLVAVASYDAGIALHRRGGLQLEGVVPIPEGVADVAYDSATRTIFAIAARGSKLYALSRDTWKLRTTDGIALGNELAVDPHSGAVFVSNRDVGGNGALTRIIGGKVQRVVTGKTAEGLALDAVHHRIYVGNVNDDTIAELDTRTLARLRTFKTVTRPFGIALDAARGRLFVVSNEPQRSQTTAPSVVAIDLHPAVPRATAHSAHFTFPLGAAYDAQRDRLFVTDEGAGKVYVLSGATLAAVHAPLHTCSVPWRPMVDVKLRRLYVPCARAGTLAAYDLDSLQALPGTPAATGGYPLAVSSLD